MTVLGLLILCCVFFFFFLIFWLLDTARDKDSSLFSSHSENIIQFSEHLRRSKQGILYHPLSPNPFGVYFGFIFLIFFFGKRKARTRGIGQTSLATQWRGFQIRRIWRTSHGRKGNRTRHPGKRTRKSLLVFQTAASLSRMALWGSEDHSRGGVGQRWGWARHGAASPAWALTMNPARLCLQRV